MDRRTGHKQERPTTIADFQYQFNNANNMSQMTDGAATNNYAYDLVDRLTSAGHANQPNENYAYDGVGNRTTSHLSASYNYQPFNKLTSTATASYIYNNNGNMISKSDASGTTQYAWDFENRLTQVVTPSSGSVTYKYDALGRRIQRAPSSGASTNFIYDDQDVVKDINSDGTTVEYLNGPGIDNKIRQKGSSTSTTYYFSHDHLGSTTALSGTTGKLVERITYDAYGNSAGSTRTRYGYTGRERDPLTTVLYYRARFYDAQLGRFISEDPIGLAGGINSFAYVGNNPVLYRDPSGLCPPEKKCEQDKTGRDMDDIKKMLRRAGLLDSISNIRSAAGQKSPEGILFNINNAQGMIATIRSGGHFTQDIPTEHLGQVGGNFRNSYGFRSYTDSRDGFGPDSTGFRRSLQIAVGPAGRDPRNPQRATGYADLDCDNPDQDIISALKHGLPIIFRRIGGLF